MARKSGPRVIESSFASECPKCGGWMPRGTKVEWEKGRKAWHAGGCPDKPAPRPRVEFRPVEPIVAAGKEAARALPALRVAAAAAHAAWVRAVGEAGGCAVCEGKGAVRCPAVGCYSGAVRVMSDVWDPCGTCHGSGSVPCACGGRKSPAAVAAVPAVSAAEKVSYEARRAVESAEAKVSRGEAVRWEVRRGVRARVFKGRKVPVGTSGVVVWVGEGAYGTRCGIKTESGEVAWTAASNVEVTEVPVEVPVEESAAVAA